MLAACGNVATDPTGREKASHGTPGLPVACYLDDLAAQPVPWHWHDEFEVAWVVRGTAVFSADAKRYELAVGDGIFVNSGVLHSAWGADGCELPNVLWGASLVGGERGSVFWERYLTPLMSCGDAAVVLRASDPWGSAVLAAAGRAWDACAHEPAGYEFMLRAELSDFVRLLCERLPTADVVESASDRRARRSEERMKAMLECIEARYDEPLRVVDIAAAASVSESECLRCFAEVVGATPIQYLRRYRVERAAEQLTASDATVAEVSRACGFNEPGYFSRVFREIKGASPAEWRQLLRNRQPSTALA